MRITRWHIRSKDLKTATLLLEYRNDVISVPLDRLSAATVIILDAAPLAERWRILLNSQTTMSAPISMSTLMNSHYDDINWHDEQNKVGTITAIRPNQISLSIANNNHGTTNIAMPIPDDHTLSIIFGRQ